MLAAASAAVLFVLAQPMHAAAESATLLVFYAPASSPEPVTEVRSALEKLAQERGVALLDLSPPVDDQPKAPELLARAIAHYREFAIDQALAELDLALAEVQRTGGAGLDHSELSDLFLYRALVDTQRGDDTAAWDDLVAAVTIDPARQLDPVRFPPGVLDNYARAVAAVTEGKWSTVTIECDRRCVVSFDNHVVRPGQEIRTPWGSHFLRIECTGYEPYGARVHVAENRRIVAPILQHITPPTAETVQNLALERGADRVVFAVAVLSEGMSPTILMRLIDVGQGGEQSRVIVALTDDDRDMITIVDQAKRMLTPTSQLAVPTEVTPAVKPNKWYQRGWVWGITGVVVTSAVLVPFLIRDDPPDGFGVELGGGLP